MIISCEKCNTRYVVKANSIGPKGRSVKCANCSYVWLQLPLEEAPADATPPTPANDQVEASATESHETTGNTGHTSTSSINAGRKLPVSTAHLVANAPLWLKAAVFVLLFVCTTCYIVFYRENVMASIPSLSGVFQAVGLGKTEGVAFQDVSLQKEGDALFIVGKIINESEMIKPLPTIRVVILNDDKDKIGAFHSPATNNVLKPHETYDFRNRITNLPKNATFVVLDIGSRLELALR